jgi:hypothetical protein
MKKVSYLIATLLVFGLTLNVIDGIKVDLEGPSVELELREAVSQISLPEDPWPDDGERKCRCLKNSLGNNVCDRGRFIDFRPICAVLAGPGDCGNWSANCIGLD